MYIECRNYITQYSSIIQNLNFARALVNPHLKCKLFGENINST